MTASWRDDVDALTFIPAGHVAPCFVHRRAFRALIGHAASPPECLAWFNHHRAGFEAAAAAKIAVSPHPTNQAFHLTSRDIRRGAGPPSNGR